MRGSVHSRPMGRAQKKAAARLVSAAVGRASTTARCVRSSKLWPLAGGWRFFYTYRDPVNAFRAVLQRAMTEEEGPTIELATHAATHRNSLRPFCGSPSATRMIPA
jgi:hypothetical protein